MKWYDLLITNEFMDYFCNDGNVYYNATAENCGYIPEPLFKKFIDTVNGITLALTQPGFSLIKDSVLFNVYMTCQTVVPHGISLSDIFHSILPSPYQADIKHLNAEQIATLILYPFWSRMGGSYEIDFLNSGRLRQYLLELKKRAQE